MPLLGIISDSHDRLDNLPHIIHALHNRGATQLLHAGDWKSAAALRHVIALSMAQGLPLKGVLGNNDRQLIEMLCLGSAWAQAEIADGVLTWQEDGRTIALYHGHHKPTVRKLLSAEAIDIVCLGHSHKPLVKTEQGKLIVNPGSTAFAIPRSRLWRASAALVDPQHMAAELIFF